MHHAPSSGAMGGRAGEVVMGDDARDAESLATASPTLTKGYPPPTISLQEAAAKLDDEIYNPHSELRLQPPAQLRSSGKEPKLQTSIQLCSSDGHEGTLTPESANVWAKHSRNTGTCTSTPSSSAVFAF
ncbi:hypothetical protein IAR50_005726 [Cryptococcus sp. DSM 104548]